MGGKPAETSFKHFVQMTNEPDASAPEAVRQIVLRGASRAIAALYPLLIWDSHQQRLLRDAEHSRDSQSLM